MLTLAVNKPIDTLLRILNSFGEDVLTAFDAKSHGVEGKSSSFIDLFMGIRNTIVLTVRRRILMIMCLPIVAIAGPPSLAS